MGWAAHESRAMSSPGHCLLLVCPLESGQSYQCAWVRPLPRKGPGGQADPGALSSPHQQAHINNRKCPSVAQAATRAGTGRGRSPKLSARELLT